MELDCSGKMGMLFLIIINIIFMLLGMGLVIPGILVQVNVDIVNQHVMPLMDQLYIGDMSLGNAANGLSVTFIIIGAVILLIACFGAFGACYQNRCMLISYAIIVALWWIAQIVMVILWFVMRDKVETEIKGQMLTQLQRNYKSDDLTSHEISTAWNYLTIELKCCGVDAVNGTTNDYDNSVWQTSNNTTSNPTEQIPKGCCGATATDYDNFTKPECTNNVTNGYFTTGCYQAIKDKVMTYSSWFIGLGITVLVVEILAIISACLICKQVGRKDQMV